MAISNGKTASSLYYNGPLTIIKIIIMIHVLKDKPCLHKLMIIIY